MEVTVGPMPRRTESDLDAELVLHRFHQRRPSAAVSEGFRRPGHGHPRHLPRLPLLVWRFRRHGFVVTVWARGRDPANRWLRF